MRTSCLLLLLALTTGCGDAFSNAVFDTDQAFLDAVPRARDLRLTGPLAEDGVIRQALIGQTAELYAVTRSTTLQVDRAVFHQLREVERLVAEPPTERGEDRRVWGPFRHPLDDFETRFVMTRADGAFEYAYQTRPASGGGDFEVAIDGRFDPERSRVGAGQLTFHLGAGAFTVTYVLEEDGSVDMELAARALDGDGDTGYDANYAYRRDAGGTGDFEMAVRGANGDTFELRTRWTAAGPGRADVRGGDGVRTHMVSECWDAVFARTWYDAGALEEGDAGSCAFAEAALPERVSLPVP